ncbi:sugar transferase [Pseudoalteromonas sp. SWN166]|uniref:sugar transferase n=1 Tax=Pseudoalteromonas sp. SWN166 TaxID=2792061 RepID=UPI0018CE9EF8|nr:sugar transferase [Pseudoalteromonas sp. SWN166]MBH0038961.1 sugar transferase [Pseudoalteromonas sp. SWN166]
MIKRIFDILISLLALFFLAPVIFFVAVLIRLKLGAPILFTQDRPGMDGKVFKMMKFRSMNSDKDEQGDLLPDEQRMTKFGMFIRSTSIDELPGLYNVLKGDMSLVGPRPLLVKYLPYYSKRELLRHNVRPGITGWAQVHGRNTVCWNKRLALDVWYVENRTFLLDLRILIMTILKVIKKDGIIISPSSSMKDFDEERGSYDKKN